MSLPGTLELLCKRPLTNCVIMGRRTLMLSALRAYESAARFRSIAAAAAKLGVTPGAISQQVKLLEEEIGDRLFLRRPQSLELTETGSKLYESLKDAFDLIESAIDNATSRQNRKALHVTMPAIFASGWFFPRLKEFDRRHPDVDLRLHSSSNFMEPSLQGVDIAVRHGRAGWGALDCMHLVADELAVVQARGSTDSIRDTCTLLASETEPNLWEEWAEHAGVDVSRQHKLLLADDALVLQAALNGVGAALLDVRMINGFIQTTALEVLSARWKRGTAWYLVMDEGRRSEPSISAFVSWAREAMADQ
jgi:LysR family glycine cleavage system transcriptional activator